MMNTDKNTDETEDSNAKVVNVNGEKKYLLMDDDESLEISENISDSDLQEIINLYVKEAIEDSKKQDRSLYEGFIDEAEYPEGFSMEEFKSLPSFKKRVQYAREHLGRIAGGSARIVFTVDPNTVVKIARNRKGQAQNEIEVDASNIGYDVIAEVKDYDDENFLYIEMEKARKLKKSDWKNLTGWKFDDWMNTLNNYMQDKNPTRAIKFRLPVPEDFEDIEETELFNDVVMLLADFDMPTGDVMRPSSWGVVLRDGKEVPVLIDYGLTKEIYKQFYQ